VANGGVARGDVANGGVARGDVANGGVVTDDAVRADARLARARARVAAVPDPEIPAVTLEDLGILRDVRREGERLVVSLTPTYTGCPATQVIAQDVRDALAAEGFADAEVRLELSPPWTTDWITEAGRRKLLEYGIAPPARAAGDGGGGGACVLAPPGTAEPAESVLRFVPRLSAARGLDPVACPQCGSMSVERLSEYGSTPCKALYRCIDCREPFDYFKPY
jgi:ring-1,2-phenylacetyl-CoA epoxidase subunit PaaD